MHTDPNRILAAVIARHTATVAGIAPASVLVRFDLQAYLTDLAAIEEFIERGTPLPPCIIEGHDWAGGFLCQRCNQYDQKINQ